MILGSDPLSVVEVQMDCMAGNSDTSYGMYFEISSGRYSST